MRTRGLDWQNFGIARAKFADLFRGCAQTWFMHPAGAARTIAVLRNFQAERECPKMRYLAKKLDGRLGVAVFQFAVGCAHAAE